MEQAAKSVVVEAKAAALDILPGKVALVEQGVEYRGVAEQEEYQLESVARKAALQIRFLISQRGAVEQAETALAREVTIQARQLGKGLLPLAGVQDALPSVCGEEAA